LALFLYREQQNMDELVRELGRCYEQVQEQAALAARRCGRDPQSVRIVAVSKGQPVEKVQAAYQAGIVRLGENYPEETARKIAQMSPAAGIEWHMIGHLQSRKVSLVAEHFQWFHALDRLSIAARLDAALQERYKPLPVLLEMNTGGESSKNGWPAINQADWEALLPDVEALLAFPHLQIRGLMCMPPLTEDAVRSRPYFAQLSRLRDFLAARYPGSHWEELSMGTSVDYPIAIEEGATLIRVGQAILGPRNYNH
jgi:PLP dependent protein